MTTVNTPRLQSLLAYLVLHRQAPQPRHHLAFVFWPDSTEAHARGSLRKLVHQMTTALPDAETFLAIDGNDLQWRPQAPYTLDAADFETAAGDQANPDALSRAVDSYRGDLLPSCYDDWIIPERERLRQLFVHSLERLVRDLESRRQYGPAISYAQRLLAHDPLQEETCRDLMRLYALNGDRAGALRTFHACATALERELGIEPSPIAKEQYELLLKADADSLSPATPAAPLVASAPLVGRQKEWTSLLEAWRAAALGGPQFVLLSGAAGIGKSRLAEEFVEWARRQGIATASTRCYPAEGALAYAPIVGWLRSRPLPSLATRWRTEVARLVPELAAEDPGLPAPAPLTQSWQRQHLFEAIARALLGGPQPLLLAIEDLQWCDRETLEWLHYLLRYDDKAALLVLGTVRVEEMSANEALTALLLSLRRANQLTEIELGALTLLEAAELAGHITRRQVAPDAAERLYRETEGNSLFVVEMARASVLETVGAEGQAGTSRLPPTIQAVIRAHLAQLSPFGHEVAAIAAAMGREFKFKVLLEASGESEDALVRALDELWQKRVLREQASGGYDFTHDKLRQVAYGDLGAARRQFWHRRIALALEALYVDNLDEVSGEIASHYDRANLFGRAVPYFRRAADAARRSYANRDAIDMFRRGIELYRRLGTDQPGGSSEVEQEAALLYGGLGDALELVSQHDEARESYSQALERVAPGDLAGIGHWHRLVGNTFKSQGRYQEAIPEYDLAEKALDQGLAGGATALWEEWIQLQFDRFALYYGQADVGRMSELTERVKPFVLAHGTALQRAHLYRLFIQTNFRRERYIVSDSTLAYARAAFDTIQEAGEVSHLQPAWFDLGFVSLWRGAFDDAEANLKRAAAHDERIGNVYDLMLDLTYLTVLYRKTHRAELVGQYARRALATATEAGMPGYVASAKGNLAWLAWHEGSLAEAQSEARAAVDLWPPVYPFQWIALTPLLDIALRRNHVSEAVECARKLLDPLQQALPKAIAEPLQNAIRRWEQGEAKTASSELAIAIKACRDLGYL